MIRGCNTHGRDEIVKPEGKNHPQDLGVDGQVILEWILGK
jgi:hypothetical protein